MRIMQAILTVRQNRLMVMSCGRFGSYTLIDICAVLALRTDVPA